MPPPTVNVFGKLGDDFIFRVDGRRAGSRYKVTFEATDFRGKAWETEFSLDALKNACVEVVPSEDELIDWLKSLGDSPTLKLKSTGGADEAHVEADLEELETLRIPPTDTLTRADAKRAAEIAAAMASDLYEEWRSATRAADLLQKQVKSQQQDGGGAAVSSQSPHVQRSGFASPQKSQRLQMDSLAALQSPQMSQPQGQTQHHDINHTAGSPEDMAQMRAKKESSEDEDDAPLEQKARRTVTGRGRGRGGRRTLGGIRR